MFTFKSASPNGINGTAKYLVDVYAESSPKRPHQAFHSMHRYEVYAARELAILRDGEVVFHPSEPPIRPWSHKLLGMAEAHQGKIDGSRSSEWFYYVDTPYGVTKEFEAEGFDWREAADWLIGHTNPSGDIYDLAYRFFSFGNLVGDGITPLFNEQFIDLGA